MFFTLSKIFAPMIHPLTHIMLFVLFALFCRQPRIAKISLLLALGWLFLFGTPFLPNALIQHLENRYPQPEPMPQAEAVVVLSGMIDIEKSTASKIEFGEGVERILEGMRLVKQGTAQKLILSGGSGSLFEQTKSEAVMLRQFALDFGIPADQILIEPVSRNTRENAVETAKLMRRQGISSIILVTTATHLPRAMGCFRKVGLHPIPYGVDVHGEASHRLTPLDLIPDVGNLRGVSWVLHEYVGLVMYKATGYI